MYYIFCTRFLTFILWWHICIGHNRTCLIKQFTDARLQHTAGKKLCLRAAGRVPKNVESSRQTIQQGPGRTSQKIACQSTYRKITALWKLMVLKTASAGLPAPGLEEHPISHWPKCFRGHIIVSAWPLAKGLQSSKCKPHVVWNSFPRWSITQNLTSVSRVINWCNIQKHIPNQRKASDWVKHGESLKLPLKVWPFKSSRPCHWHLARHRNKAEKWRAAVARSFQRFTKFASEMAFSLKVSSRSWLALINSMLLDAPCIIMHFLGSKRIKYDQAASHLADCACRPRPKCTAATKPSDSHRLQAKRHVFKGGKRLRCLSRTAFEMNDTNDWLNII